MRFYQTDIVDTKAHIRQFTSGKLDFSPRVDGGIPPGTFIRLHIDKGVPAAGLELKIERSINGQAVEKITSDGNKCQRICSERFMLLIGSLDTDFERAEGGVETGKEPCPHGIIHCITQFEERCGGAEPDPYLRADKIVAAPAYRQKIGCKKNYQENKNQRSVFQFQFDYRIIRATPKTSAGKALPWLSPVF